MKERPILFSAPMVRALLDGSKTQTRREIKWPWDVFDGKPIYRPNRDAMSFRGDKPLPYGQPGDRLWVREAFIHEPADYCWEASVSIPCRPATTVYRADQKGDTRGAGWTPSIHMPRALSRITLELTEVRVERLQDISETDAIAEGIERHEDGDGWQLYNQWGKVLKCLDARTSYSSLWAKINGPGSWDANPWVWVLSFKRAMP